MLKIIKLALHSSGKILHVDDALNGLACDCTCLVCSERLQAVHPRLRQTYFRHNKNLFCTGGPETALHLYAKQILLSNDRVSIPGRTLSYTNPQAEVGLGIITPDVTVEAGDFKVHFEIVVTHYTTAVKEWFYRKNEHKAIEIDLSRIPYNFDKKEIEGIVLDEVENKKILFWTKRPPVPTKKSDHDWLWKLAGLLSVVWLIPKIWAYFSRKLFG